MATLNDRGEIEFEDDDQDYWGAKYSQTISPVAEFIEIPRKELGTMYREQAAERLPRRYYAPLVAIPIEAPPDTSWIEMQTVSGKPIHPEGFNPRHGRYHQKKRWFRR